MEFVYIVLFLLAVAIYISHRLYDRTLNRFGWQIGKALSLKRRISLPGLARTGASTAYTDPHR